MALFGEKFTIVVVCKANQTRSAYLEGYMRHYLKQHLPHACRKVRILSAGIQARRGGAASQVVKHVAKQNGFSLAGHRSSPLTPKMVKSADAVLVMEKSQGAAIVKHYPEAEQKTFRITEYLRHEDTGPVHDIPDPTGQNTDEYRTFIEVAHGEVERIFRELGREGLL